MPPPCSHPAATLTSHHCTTAALTKTRATPSLPSQVLPARVPYLASWDASKTMHGALTEIKNMLNRGQRVQPPDGSQY